MAEKRGERWRCNFRYLNPKTGTSQRCRQSLGPEIHSRREAEKVEALLRAQLEQRAPEAGPPEAPAAAFSGFARLWLDTYVAANCKPSVVRRYETALRVHLVPFFGDVLLSELTLQQIERYKAQARKRAHPTTGRLVSLKTIAEELCTLSSMLNTAVKWGYLARSPTQGLSKLKTAAPAFRFYTREQSEVFLRVAAELTPDWHPFFLLGFRSGLRLGEMLGLQWADLDFGQGLIHVQRALDDRSNELTLPKGNRTRIVPMAPDLVPALRAMRHLRGPLVFCGDNAGPLGRDNVKHPFRRVLRVSELPPIRIHDMRHSFASQLVIAGTPINAVQEMLGHTDIRQTQRYAHLGPGAKPAYVALLSGPTLAPAGSAPPIRARKG